VQSNPTENKVKSERIMKDWEGSGGTEWICESRPFVCETLKC